jgi:hypothetical protein
MGKKLFQKLKFWNSLNGFFIEGNQKRENGECFPKPGWF